MTVVLLTIALVLFSCTASGTIIYYDGCSANCQSGCTSQNIDGNQCLTLPGPEQLWVTCGPAKGSSCLNTYTVNSQAGCATAATTGISQSFLCNTCLLDDPLNQRFMTHRQYVCHIGSNLITIRSACDNTCQNCANSTTVQAAAGQCVPDGGITGQYFLVNSISPCQAAQVWEASTCRTTQTLLHWALAGDRRQCLWGKTAVQCPATNPIPDLPVGVVQDYTFTASFQAGFQPTPSLTTLQAQLRAFFLLSLNTGDGANNTFLAISAFTTINSTSYSITLAPTTSAPLVHELYMTESDVLLNQFGITSLQYKDFRQQPAPEEKSKGWIAAVVIVVLLVLAAGGYFVFTRMKRERSDYHETTTFT